jgi:hypothetical protein
MQKKRIDGINIYYVDVSWLEKVEEVLSILRDEDPWHYAVVKQRVGSLVQLGLPHNWNKGRSINYWAAYCRTYFDEFTNAQRVELGPRRYAASIVGLATLIKIIERFKLYAAHKPRWRYYNRTRRITARSELYCCEKLNCEMKYIYNLRRWIRNHP